MIAVTIRRFKSNVGFYWEWHVTVKSFSYLLTGKLVFRQSDKGFRKVFVVPLSGPQMCPQNSKLHAAL
jgi:hypothetical protein